ncbi:MAG TPA: hypothetical protein VIC30_08055 [Orrella sp.]
MPPNNPFLKQQMIDGLRLARQTIAAPDYNCTDCKCADDNCIIILAGKNHSVANVGGQLQWPVS